MDPVKEAQRKVQEAEDERVVHFISHLIHEMHRARHEYYRAMDAYVEAIEKLEKGELTAFDIVNEAGCYPHMRKR